MKSEKPSTPHLLGVANDHLLPILIVLRLVCGVTVEAFVAGKLLEDISVTLRKDPSEEYFCACESSRFIWVILRAVLEVFGVRAGAGWGKASPEKSTFIAWVDRLIIRKYGS
eukprot:CAMPEP_0169178876 /NCGR_PEP_ID=MMETSP1015-20121227/67300_1 /TAXON_ID=342587 /ORGANISM="Karlodinium micrum, Strain CCMP2283" /LENGTH=111 /DNA_ID=CAMNT_0009253805 /DNA_START=34 /DNA_END=365 /DNA_ORIENTATION=+